MSRLAIREPAVSGSFYPGSRDSLQRELGTLFDGARSQAAHDRRSTANGGPGAPLGRTKALVVPHAGYVYSGPVAARGYEALRPLCGSIDRVVLLGPAHRVYVESMALPACDAFSTPLGLVPVDAELRDIALGCRGVQLDDRPHVPEHSLEVHLPFLQEVLGDGWTLMPVLVGRSRDSDVADLLERVWGGDETVIIVSSDLSHYEPYALAREHDRRTASAILDLDTQRIMPDDACGAFPLRGLLVAAERRGLVAEQIDLRSSGDTAGDGASVVGYGAFAFHERDGGQVEVGDHAVGGGEVGGGAVGGGEVAESAACEGDARQSTNGADVAASSKPGMTDDDRCLVLETAMGALSALFNGTEMPDTSPQFLSRQNCSPRVRREGASFVTLRAFTGELLGCIGSIKPYRPLLEDVAANAISAATRDPRFRRVRKQDLTGGEVDVSVLSPLEEFPADDRETVLQEIVPGRDGLVIEAVGRRATFLPSVWEQLPNPDSFLDQLMLKAGLDPSHWPDGMRAWKYWSESVSRRVGSF